MWLFVSLSWDNAHPHKRTFSTGFWNSRLSTSCLNRSLSCYNTSQCSTRRKGLWNECTRLSCDRIIRASIEGGLSPEGISLRTPWEAISGMALPYLTNAAEKALKTRCLEGNCEEGGYWTSSLTRVGCTSWWLGVLSGALIKVEGQCSQMSPETHSPSMQTSMLFRNSCPDQRTG